MGDLDISTHARAKGDMVSTGVDVCFVMCKLRVHGLCLWACNYVMVVMKLLQLEVLSVCKQGENTLFLLYVFYFKKTDIYVIENSFRNF